MIRRCTDNDIDAIYAIINDSARAYEGHIPGDCYHWPYMPMDELLAEIAAGVEFWGLEQEDTMGLPRLVAVMGIQDRGPVMLIRHAYTRSELRGKGLGSELLVQLLGMAYKPVLIGTWRDATWAIRFYQKHGFRLVRPEEKDRLLRRFWTISERQVETSVVLADDRYRETAAGT
jgi:GNAT superfamily N-acetyltransferase